MTNPNPETPAAPPASGDAVQDYGDPIGEYETLHHVADHATGRGAIVVDRSYRSRGTFAGAKAREVLTGLVTNDVLSVAPGAGCYAAALTSKGKIIADVRLFVREDDVFIDVPPRAAAGWWAMIRKFVNPRLSRYQDVSAGTAELAVFGAGAHSVVSAATGIGWEELAQLPVFSHRSVEAFGVPVLVARVPDLGVEGFSLFLPVEAREAAWQGLQSHGARAAGLAAFEIARIEAGRPEWGVEIDDGTLAQEANMDELHAISYTKGCYTGQETVARVHFRGHVNRHLRGLRFDEDQTVAVRAALLDDAGKSVGEVRSAVVSPRLGGIALAMVRREVEPDVELDAVWDGGRARVRVVSLPFPS